jgi:hypothetical protein
MPGGEDQAFAQEADLLRSHGHQVLLYQASNDQVTSVNFDAADDGKLSWK